MVSEKTMPGFVMLTMIVSALMIVLVFKGLVHAESTGDTATSSTTHSSASTNIIAGWSLIFDTGIRGTYESNVNGASVDVSKKGDFYTTFSAGIGGYKEVAQKTFIFGRVDGLGAVYSKYSDLNVAAGGVTLGVRKGLNDVFSAEGAFKVAAKGYKDSPRDSTAYGMTLVLSEQINPKLWIKEGYEYENNSATSSLFSYTGNQVGVWSGYLIDSHTMINAGYSYLTRKYDDPSGFTTNTHTLSFGAVRELVRKIYLNAEYDHQFNNSNIQNYSNNIYTLGLTYSY